MPPYDGPLSHPSTWSARLAFSPAPPLAESPSLLSHDEERERQAQKSGRGGVQRIDARTSMSVGPRPPPVSIADMHMVQHGSVRNNNKKVEKRKSGWVALSSESARQGQEEGGGGVGGVSAGVALPLFVGVSSSVARDYGMPVRASLFSTASHASPPPHRRHRAAPKFPLFAHEKAHTQTPSISATHARTRREQRWERRR